MNEELERDVAGPIAVNVAENLERLRGNRTYEDLSAALKMLGLEFPEYALRRIKGGGRRVTVEELVGLAMVLNVSPATLLMPHRFGASDLVQVSRRRDSSVPAEQMWLWLTATQPLIGQATTLDQFTHEALPPFASRQRR